MSQPVLPPDGNRNRGPAVITIFWTECIIAGVFVALRFRARIMIRGIGIDDWIMLFTQVQSSEPFASESPYADQVKSVAPDHFGSSPHSIRRQRWFSAPILCGT